MSGIYEHEPLWGQWRIEGEAIGRGSYGQVYKIYRDINGKREYAAAKYISIPKDKEEIEAMYNSGRVTDSGTLSNALKTRADMFTKEIELMIKLKGAKNIVRYESHIKEEKKQDVGWDIIIMMELLTPLRKYLRTNTFTKKEVVKLGIDMCSAVESCQAEKIIHRDIKIENIFLDDKGIFKLGDFGVSREAQGTTMGTLAGTNDYMAPEVIRHLEYNNNIDIYSIGIVMYRMLNNNRIPFLPAVGIINDNDVTEAINKRVAGELPLPNPAHAEEALSRIILKACEYDRHKRYSNPVEMANDLRAVLDKIQDNVVLRPQYGVKSADNHESATSTELNIGGTVNEINLGMERDDKKQDIGTVKEDVTGGTISENDNNKTISEIPHSSTRKKKSVVKKLAIAACVVVMLAGVGGGVAVYRNNHKIIPITDISRIPQNSSIIVGDTMTIQADVFPNNTTSVVKYKSSDSSIAYINQSGYIYAKAVGDVIITATADGVSREMKLSVTEKKINVTDIIGLPDNAELILGGSTNIHGQVQPENATVQTISYASSDLSVADIGTDGVINTFNAGVTVISAEADGVKKEMTLTVIAPTPEPTPMEEPVAKATPNTTKKTQRQATPKPKTTSNNTKTSSNNSSNNAPVAKPVEPASPAPPQSVSENTQKKGTKVKREQYGMGE